MSYDLTRRLFLTSALGSVAGAAFSSEEGGAPEGVVRSRRPRARPDRIAPSVPYLLERARLGEGVSFVVADARSGAVLESHQGGLSQPPASVAKIVTALYGVDALGPVYRFATRVLATGPVVGGRLDGDLVLVGVGDPLLNTDALAGLAAQVSAMGIREITGRFLICATALPFVRSIDPGQPAEVGYSPAVSGLNLNFNRVHFEWKQKGKSWTVAMDARAERYRPEVRVARMGIVARRSPVYTYEDGGGHDRWTVAASALGKRGARWLPVRKPALYTGEVFQLLCAHHGLKLGAPVAVDHVPAGEVVALREGLPLAEVVRGMLKFSTNLTAEVIGLSASRARGVRPEGLEQSALEMSVWARERFGLGGAARLYDHSGLSDLSRLSSQDLVSILTLTRQEPALLGLLKRIYLRDGKGRPLYEHPFEVRAKTGTLNFVSGLAGYAGRVGGRRLVFAIFAADEAARAAIAPQNRERPRGAKSWNTRARRLQQELLARWDTLYTEV